MDSPRGAERTIICLNALAQILSEIWPKNCFWCFYYDFFTQNPKAFAIFVIETWNWVRLKAYDIAQGFKPGIFEFRPRS